MTSIRVCLRCGEAYRSVRASHIYCTKTCYSRSSQWRINQAALQTNEEISLPGEEWRQFPDTRAKQYEISSVGRIRLMKRTDSGDVRYRIRKPYKGPNSFYYTLDIDRRKKRGILLVHRMVIEAFKGKPDGERNHCAHLDGNPLNNRIENLAWATPLENNLHKIDHGTMTRGEAVNTAVLREADVRTIRRMRQSGMSYQSIGAKFGVTQTPIYAICKGKSWKHVK